MHITSGSLKHQKIAYEALPNVRPTKQRIRQAIFNILKHQFHWDQTPQTVLDAFAGTGAFGFEALSQGAEKAIFVEKDKKTALFLKKNVFSLQLQTKAEIQNCDIQDLQTSSSFSVVFIDPPYFDHAVEPMLDHLLEKKFLQADAVIIIESAKRDALNIQKIATTKGLLCPFIRYYGKIAIGFYQS